MKAILRKIFLVICYPFCNKAVSDFFKEIKASVYFKSVKGKLKSCGKAATVGAGLQIRGEKYISIGENFSAGKHTTIQAWDRFENDTLTPEIVIGDNVMLTDFVQISATNKVVLGDNLLVGQNVLITDNSHGNFEHINIPPMKRPLKSKGPVIIGKNVWIGRGAIILSGVTIGDNAIIGANSVVTRSVPPNSAVAGSPARVIKTAEN